MKYLHFQDYIIYLAYIFFNLFCSNFFDFFRTYFMPIIVPIMEDQ